MSGPSNARPGDWQCTGCSDFQFARNTHCRKCQTPRPGLDPALVAQGPPPTATVHGGASNLFVADLPSHADDNLLRSLFGAYGVVIECKVLPSKTPGMGTCAGLVRMQTVEEAAWIVENLNGNIPQGLDAAISVKFAASAQEKQVKQSAWLNVGQDNPTLGSNPVKGTWKGGGKGGDGGSYGKAGKGGGKGDYGHGPYSKGGGGGGGWGMGGCDGGWMNGGMGGGMCGKGGKDNQKGSIWDLSKGLAESGALPGCQAFSNEVNALFVGNLPPDTTDQALYQIFGGFGAIPAKGVRAMMHPDGTCKGFGFVNFLDAAAAQAAAMALNGAQTPSGQTLVVQVKPAGGGKGGANGAQGGGQQGMSMSPEQIAEQQMQQQMLMQQQMGQFQG